MAQDAIARPEALTQSKTSYRWVVMGLIFLVYTMAAADRANIGIVLPFIKNEFNMSNTEAGAVVSLFFIGYSLAQIPAGFLVKRFGVRLVFPTFMILTRISHKFCDAMVIWGKKVSRRKRLACARRVHPFRQSVFQP